MERTKSAGGVVVSSNGEILVVSQKDKRYGDSWSLPKGHIDKGETPLRAAKREIYEESGIKHLMLVARLGSYKRFKIGKNGGDNKAELKTIFMFLFKTSDTKLHPVDPDNPKACWVKKGKVARLLTHRKDKKFFREILPCLKELA